MQRQRDIIDSFPEPLDFNQMPPPSANAILGQQSDWNMEPAENLMEDLMLSPGHLDDTFINLIDQERPSFGGWSFGESSSSGGQNVLHPDEQKQEHAWSSSLSARAGAGPGLEESIHERGNILSLDGDDVTPQCFEISDSSAIRRNLNLNVSFEDDEDDSYHAVEGPYMYNANRVQNELSSSSANGSNDTLIPCCSAGRRVDENDIRSSYSPDNCLHFRKRKATEENVGSPSVGGSSSFFQQQEASPSSSVPSRYNEGSSLSVPVPSERAIPRPGLGCRSVSSDSSNSHVARDAERSHRNVRLRISRLSQEPEQATVFSTGVLARQSTIPHQHPSLRDLAIGSYELQSLPAVNSTATQNLETVFPIPSVSQSWPSDRWDQSSSMRPGSSSMAIPVRESGQANSRSLVRSLWDYPIPAPVNEVRNSISGGEAGGFSGVSGNAASTSRAGSGWGSHPLSASSSVPPPNFSSRSARRLAEHARRSLLASIAESGGGDLHSPAHVRPTDSSGETSGSGSQVHRRSYPRSASWMDRQVEGPLGVHLSQTLIGATEGRSRLVSEQIRNVLGLMRRGESLRLEDVMMLDQSVFFGAGDTHDRHRDMRLDVDNMSYEELLALEERIGNVSTGLSEETIMKSLKQRKYSVALPVEVETEPCCICQEEYIDDEDLGTLDCGHDFHTECIKQWLMHKNWCPICKTTGLSSS